MLAFGKIQLCIQHFGAEKLDIELYIKWGRTFRMTCSKTGDVFLRQRLFYARENCAGRLQSMAVLLGQASGGLPRLKPELLFAGLAI